MFVISRRNSKVDTNSITKKLDSISCKIDTINTHKDSLKEVYRFYTDSLKIINNNYEKEYSHILTQSTDSDIVFFTEYLSKRFPNGIDNTSTAEGN